MARSLYLLITATCDMHTCTIHSVVIIPHSGCFQGGALIKGSELRGAKTDLLI